MMWPRTWHLKWLFSGALLASIAVLLAVSFTQRVKKRWLFRDLWGVNEYKDGYLYVNDGPGEGHIYRIKVPSDGGDKVNG